LIISEYYSFQRRERPATLHVNDGVARRAADKRIVRKHGVFGRIVFTRHTVAILHSVAQCALIVSRKLKQNAHDVSNYK